MRYEHFLKAFCATVVALALFFSGGPARADEPLRVAMILPGSDTDKGWNQMAREGLDRIKKELKAETKIVTNVNSSDFYTRMSDFASDGYDVVICHGGEFEKVAAEAAKTFPKTLFIVGGCPNEIPGVVSVDFLTKDASELVGLVAASVSKNGHIAFVGADPVAPLQACYDGFAEGARQTRSGITVMPALWTNSWDSPSQAREKTEAAISSGADVIYQNVDAAALGVFQACQDANKSGKHILAFGCNSNQNDVAPDVILGSVVLDVPKTYLDLTRDAQQGKLHPGSRKLGLNGGYVDLVLNDKNSAITPEIHKAVDALRQSLETQSAKNAPGNNSEKK